MKEKKFTRPELLIVQFANEDIIVTSSGTVDRVGDEGLIDTFDEE